MMKRQKEPWTPEEDQMLLTYLAQHGHAHSHWQVIPSKAGLERCGESCRLRWSNYLSPDIKRGEWSSHEDKWSVIAAHLPKRTDYEKNYWNIRLKKRLIGMGIDPMTHKPKTSSVAGAMTQSKNAVNLSHMAQWETTRLEAEARLEAESKFMSTLHHLRRTAALSLSRPESSRQTPKMDVPYLDDIKIWQSAPSWAAASNPENDISATTAAPRHLSRSVVGSLESPQSNLNFLAANSFTIPSARFMNSVSPENLGSAVAVACEAASIGNSYAKENHCNTENPIDLLENSFKQATDYDCNISGLVDLPTGNYFADGFNYEFGDDYAYWNDLLK